jgi:hypothetical protein
MAVLPLFGISMISVEESPVISFGPESPKKQPQGNPGTSGLRVGIRHRIVVVICGAMICKIWWVSMAVSMAVSKSGGCLWLCLLCTFRPSALERDIYHFS